MDTRGGYYGTSTVFVRVFSSVKASSFSFLRIIFATKNGNFAPGTATR